MKELWMLLSLITSVAAFIIVAAMQMSQGAELPETVLWSLGVFAIMWVAQMFLRSLLGFAMNSEASQEDQAQNQN